MKKKVDSVSQKFNEKPVYSQTEMKRYLGMLNETHGENLKGIKEGFVLVNKKLDEHSVILNSHTGMIGILMEDVSILKEDVSTLKSDMVIVKSDLKKRVDYDEFLSLVKRVQTLESKK